MSFNRLSGLAVLFLLAIAIILGLVAYNMSSSSEEQATLVISIIANLATEFAGGALVFAVFLIYGIENKKEEGFKPQLLLNSSEPDKNHPQQEIETIASDKIDKSDLLEFLEHMLRAGEIQYKHLDGYIEYDLITVNDKNTLRDKVSKSKK